MACALKTAKLLATEKYEHRHSLGRATSRVNIVSFVHAGGREPASENKCNEFGESKLEEVADLVTTYVLLSTNTDISTTQSWKQPSSQNAECAIKTCETITKFNLVDDQGRGAMHLWWTQESNETFSIEGLLECCHFRR